MATTGKQSPLGINLLGSLLNNTGLTINQVASSYMGISKTNTDYAFGKVVQDTVLRLLTWAINDGYIRGPGDSNTTLSDATYNNLISIGSTTLPALGNSKPPTYIVNDPANVWTDTAVAYGVQNGTSDALPGPATSGYSSDEYNDLNQGQCATWIPYNTTNDNKSATQWGYTRLHALQAWNEFNWNGTTVDSASPEYKEFVSSFTTISDWINSSNQTILTNNDANTFLDGVYSNMNDLGSADIAGVSLASYEFGQDLVNLGKAIDLSQLNKFGLPSVLLKILAKNNIITPDLMLALLAAGLVGTAVSDIVNETIVASKKQEQQIYSAFLIITSSNLAPILAALQCTTTEINVLADLLNVRKLFPISYSSLTAPVYNSQANLPTNSKTYYLISIIV